ncbi:MAG TPA: O-antigen ligase family protein [Vicinamibacterales bacterium]
MTSLSGVRPQAGSDWGLTPVAGCSGVRPRFGEWDPLLACVAGYILVAVGRVHQLFPVLQTARPAILAGLFAIALYVSDRHASRRSDLLWVRPTKLLVALLVWMTLSVPGSLSPGDSFGLVFDNFVKTVLMYVVVAGAVRDVRDVERLSGVYLAAATVYACVVLSRFELGSGDAWRLGRLYYYDANDFATFIVSALPLGLYFAHAGRRQSVRLAAAMALLVLTVAFVRTGSRGGFIALVAVGGFVLLRYRAIAAGWRVSTFVLAALLLVATASDEYWKQMGTILSDSDYNQTDESGRLQIWQRGMGYMLQHPVLGVGPGNFQMAEGTLSPFADRQQFGIGVRWNAAHSSLVQVGAELGLVGLVLFVTLIASAFGALRRVTRGHGSRPADCDAELTQALTASLFGFVVGAFFLSLAYSEMLYTLIALAVGLQKVTTRRASRAG